MSTALVVPDGLARSTLSAAVTTRGEGLGE